MEDSTVYQNDIWSTISDSYLSSTPTIATDAKESILFTTAKESSEHLAKISNNVLVNPQFKIIDYVFFIMLLLLSAIIGIYYGFISKKKQDNTKEYLLGGKTLSIIPVAISLISSHISGITVMGVPAEIYSNGTQYWAFIVPCLTIAFALNYVYLPVFFDLQLTSSFLYLEKRFDRVVRKTASIMYMLSCILFIPIVIYVPALAFSQVTNINIHLITPIICSVCVFYTTIGGLRAVVWTDTLQFGLMVISMLTILYLGYEPVGGFSNVWEIAERGKRLIFFNLDPSPFVRTSFWTVSFGLTTIWVSNLGINQGCVQRFLSVPSFQKAKQTVWIFAGGLIIIKSISCLTGLMMYAKYEHCDPATIGLVNKIDQLLAFYVMDVGGKISGLSGLFIAGIFAAALSTMSASMNTLAGTLYEDFLRERLPNASEKKASNIMKVIVIVVGIIQMLLVFIIEQLGPVFQMALSMTGITAGTLLGMFTLGMCTRKANTRGVIVGSCCSFLLVLIMMLGGQRQKKEPTLQMRIDRCDEVFPNLVNLTIINNTFINGTTNGINNNDNATDEIFWLFRISFMYYALIGILVSFAVGYPISLLTGGTENLDEILLTPMLRSKEFKLKQKKQMDNEIIHYNELETINNDDNVQIGTLLCSKN